MKTKTVTSTISGCSSLNSLHSRRNFSRASRLFAGAVIGLALHLSSSVAGAAVIGFGSVNDPANDAPRADITSASVSVEDTGHITFSALFKSNTFDSDDGDSVIFYLDLDNNSATGGTAPFGPAIGFEAFLQAPFGFGMNATGLLALWNGSSFSLSFVNFNYTPVADSFTATFPLSIFGTANPTMNFSVISVGVSGETTAFMDATSVGAVGGGGGATGVPDSGSSVLLLAASMLGLMARRRSVSSDSSVPRAPRNA
jgi:hypothetical protein